MISVFQNSENSSYEYRIATDMAMTVRMIMILPYGAGGKPDRGETPMIQISYLFLSDFPQRLARQGVLRINIATTD